MYRLIPGAQLAIFPGEDHFMMWTAPDTVLATLLPFLIIISQERQKKALQLFLQAMVQTSFLPATTSTNS